MNEIIRGAIVFLTFGCAIIIGVFVVMAWKGKGKSKPVYMTGRTWKVKQSAAQWMGRQ